MPCGYGRPPAHVSMLEPPLLRTVAISRLLCTPYISLKIDVMICRHQNSHATALTNCQVSEASYIGIRFWPLMDPGIPDPVHVSHALVIKDRS
jgi:hypothetical protein